ncbi:MAG: family 20 glycosylhydrolase [Melioribacteraceae bacterium]
MRMKYSTLRLFLIFFISIASIAEAQINLIPRPQKIEVKKGRFTLSASTVIISSAEISHLNDYFCGQILELTGIKLKVNKPAGRSSILLKLTKPQLDSGSEEYELSVEPEQIVVSSAKEEGLFRGIQTLIQICSSSGQMRESEINIPCCRIIDSPRFNWRGLNLDCARHFMSKNFVKRYIDILARYKFNIFHWHLTDDQGWRIEIKKYPKLTGVGAWRREADGTVYGGFYSQSDVKEIVAYAKSRFITIVPEIEMPGHCQASLAAYPENSCTGGPFEVSTIWGVMKDVYCAGSDSTFIFLQNVLNEVCELFPGEYIHIGGDEVPKDRWKECPGCRQRIQSEGLKDEQELQTYFIKRISNFLSQKRKKIIGWDEILEGGPAPGATVQSWQSFNGTIEAARMGHYSISSPASHTYLNAEAENLDLRACYSFDPVPGELQVREAHFVLGSEANMWTEHAPENSIDGKLFPRILALAEVFWINKENKNFEDFYSRLQNHYHLLSAMGINFGLEGKAIIHSSLFDENKNEFAITLKPAQPDLKIFYTTDGKEPNLNSEPYSVPVRIKESVTLKASVVKKNHLVGSPLSLSFTIHRALNSKVSVTNPFSDRYSAGGLNSLVNGVRGTINFRDGQWQGYEEADFNATLDLGESRYISRIILGCLQDATSWIFFPTGIQFFVSSDNINFTEAGTLVNEFPQKTSDAILRDFLVSFERLKARYVKVVAVNVGRCPDWHPGAGGKSWIFIDEIIVE